MTVLLVGCESGNWTQTAQGLICTGTLVSVDKDAQFAGLTLEDSKQLVDFALIMFATVFGFLILKKALL